MKQVNYSEKNQKQTNIGTKSKPIKDENSNLTK